MDLKNINTIIPIYTYHDPYIQRNKIYKETRNKTGIYLWTNIISDKSYIGSAVDISRRLSSYFSLGFLKLEVMNNNSLIYKALLKYNYSNFELNIIEFCDIKLLKEREQYYLDNFVLEYNILKTAGSFLGFKHSNNTIERMRLAKLGKSHSILTKLKLSANGQAFPLVVKNLKTGEVYSFASIRSAAKYINIHHSYISKCLNKKNFYTNKNFFISKKE